MESFVKVCPNWAGPMVCLFLLYFLSILTSPLGTFIQNKWLVAMRVYISTFLCHHRCSFQPKRGHMASRQKNKFAKLLSDRKTKRLFWVIRGYIWGYERLRLLRGRRQQPQSKSGKVLISAFRVFWGFSLFWLLRRPKLLSKVFFGLSAASSWQQPRAK